MSFYQELQKTQTSFLKDSPSAARIGYQFLSPILDVGVVQSPVSKSRPISLFLPALSVPPPALPSSSDIYSPLPEVCQPYRNDSVASEVLIFGPLDSPPLSCGRQSGSNMFSLGPTLRVPGYGENGEDGKEV